MPELQGRSSQWSCTSRSFFHPRLGPPSTFYPEKDFVMSAPTSPVCPTHVSQLREFDSQRHACVHELLEAVAQEHAQSIAVEFEGRTLSYAELHARANQLARVLRKHGVHREVLVAVCMERSLEMEIALLGI